MGEILGFFAGAGIIIAVFLFYWLAASESVTTEITPYDWEFPSVLDEPLNCLKAKTQDDGTEDHDTRGIRGGIYIRPGDDSGS